MAGMAGFFEKIGAPQSGQNARVTRLPLSDTRP